MQRKTLTERLTNKYLLIVRNEENFADKWQLSFNYARLLVFFTVLLILFYFIVTGLNNLGTYLLGSDDDSNETKLLLTLVAKVDSMEYEMSMKDNYISSFKNLLNGGVNRPKDTLQKKPEKYVPAPIDADEEAFRKKYEEEIAEPSYSSKDGFSTLYFNAPIVGKATEIVEKGKAIGVQVESNTKKNIKSLDVGTVISSSLNPDSSFKIIIQHNSGLVTVYDKVKKPLINSGSVVYKNTDIALAYEQKIFFSMSYNGKLLNPKDYIAWDK